MKGLAGEVEFEAFEHGDDGSDFVGALGLVVGAEREAVDFFWVRVTPSRWPTAPRMWTWHWFSPILPVAGLASPLAARASACGARGVSIDGVAHGLAVDGDGVVGAAAGGVEAPQGAVELVGVDAHQHVADDVFAGHLVAAAAVPAAEPLAGARRQVGGPFGHGLVAARAAQRGAGGDGEHHRQRMAPALAAARVVDVGEVVGQGTHGVGGDHGLRASVAVDGVERGPGQARPRVGDQGADEDQLRRGRGGAVAAAHAAEAARAPDAGPVRGAVHRAAEARRIDEGLQQHKRVAEARRPVRRQPPFAQRQHPRAQVRHAPARQDQEAAVVGEQVLAVVLRAEVPADPSGRGRRTSGPAPRSRSAPPTAPRERAAYHSVSPIFGGAPK